MMPGAEVVWTGDGVQVAAIEGKIAIGHESSVRALFTLDEWRRHIIAAKSGALDIRELIGGRS